MVRIKYISKGAEMLKNNHILLKVFGVNEKCRIVKAYTPNDVKKYAKCFKRWEYIPHGN